MHSGATTVTRRFPQRSILEPVLLILYTADIVEGVRNCSCHLYTDGLQIYISFNPFVTRTAAGQLNEDLTRIAKWSESQSGTESE